MSALEQVLLVLSLAAATWALRAAGPTLVGSRPLPARLARIIALVAPALLAGLIVWQVFSRGEHLVLDARVAGLGAAAVAVAVRAPIPVVLVVAAASAAFVRLL